MRENPPPRVALPETVQIIVADKLLRPWVAGDLDALTAAYASPDVPPTWDPRPRPLDRTDARRFIARARRDWHRGESASFAICSAGSIIGEISLRMIRPGAARIGYWLVPSARGHGSTSLLVQAIAQWSKAINIEQLEIVAASRNRASQRVAEKAGFQVSFEGTAIFAGAARQLVVFTLDQRMADAAAKSKYPRPALTADVVLFGLDRSGLQVLLVRRRNAPHRGRLALPGGYVGFEEEPVAAAARELAEETGITGIELAPVDSFGRAGRDPRGWTVSVAHLGVVRIDDVTPRAGDDAAEVIWQPLRTLPRLAFDHNEIVAAAQSALADRRPGFLADGETPGREARLLLVGGLTGAGKSSFCRTLAEGVPGLVIVDTDQLRRDLTRGKPRFGELEAWTVHDTARSLAEWALKGGHDVAIDSTGLTASDRAHYLASAPLFGVRSVLVWCETPDGLAARRLLERKGWKRNSMRDRSALTFRLNSLSRLERPRLDEAAQVELVNPATFEQVAARLTVEINGSADEAEAA